MFFYVFLEFRSIYLLLQRCLVFALLWIGQLVQWQFDVLIGKFIVSPIIVNQIDQMFNFVLRESR